jgi:SAM-dependent methyltransferase
MISSVIVFLVGTLVLFIYGFWTIIPIRAGLPWRPTEFGRILKALQLAQLQPGELLYDLGSGDGRVLVLAARQFQARAVGIEISRLHCLVSRFFAWNSRVNKQVSIIQADFYTADLHNADVVFAYMTSRQVARLRPHLESQLRPGTRVVTISFDLDGWEPQQIDRNELIFLYRMPPVPGNLGTYLEKLFESDLNGSKS